MLPEIVLSYRSVFEIRNKMFVAMAGVFMMLISACNERKSEAERQIDSVLHKEPTQRPASGEIKFEQTNR
jgi:hypothetical protein